MAAPASAVAPALRSGREHYAIRGIDLTAIAIFWALLAFVSAASRSLDPRIPGLSGRLTSAVVTATYVEYALWALLTVPIWWMSSRYAIEGGRRVGRVLLFVAIGIGLALLVDETLLRVREQLMQDLGRFRRRPLPPLFVGLGILDDLMVYFAVLGAGIARDYFLRYQARLAETAVLQAQLAQARLDVLRSQLNPHFLFNTLNAVSALVERDPRGARKMIARLSDLLRYTLEESTEQEVPLHRELDLLGEYIELMQIRFQDRLTVTMHIADNARNALVPNLILQPLVENAMKHGIGQITGAGSIRVEADREDDQLILRVVDTGPGPGEGSGVGLTNTDARLKQMYGHEAGVALHAVQPRGTEARVVLPYHVTPVAAAAR